MERYGSERYSDGIGAIVVASRSPRGVALPLVAALGCLQPGIDPVFLALLSHASHIPLSAHGLVVGATQAGAALGSLMVWRYATMLPHRIVIVAAGCALLCSQITTLADGLAATLAVRGGYGLAMGMVYAHAMAACSADRSNRAYGAVFLTQLMLSTLVSLALPRVALMADADTALRVLGLAPAAAFVALLLMANRAGAARSRRCAGDQDGDGEGDEGDVPISGAAWALAAATFWFICATMLIWSFAGALASAAGIDERAIGDAAAIGSLAGAVTALAVMRERRLSPLPVTALLACAALISPILLIAPDQGTAFLASIVLLNIGSTAIIIRCSGLATAASGNIRFRAFVACTHSLGLIAGPVLGSLMMSFLGVAGLLAGLLLSLAAGMAAIAWAVRGGLPNGADAIPILLDNAPTARLALD